MEEPSLLITIDDMQGLFAHRTKMSKQLHTEAACEKRFICGLAHFKKELDAVVFALPRQHVGVALNDDDVDQVEPLSIETLVSIY